MKSTSNITLVHGVFDLLHAGHIKLLRYAKRQCGGEIIVAVYDDTCAKIVKKSEPLNTVANRRLILESIEYVDRTILLDRIECSKLIRQIKPQRFATGKVNLQGIHVEEIAALSETQCSICCYPRREEFYTYSLIPRALTFVKS